MRILRSSIGPVLIMVLIAVSSAFVGGCASSADEEKTPAVSMPPPKEPVAGVGEAGAGNAFGPAPMKGPSND